ncbi:MAG: DNA-binding domain-containing protein, partial [Coxiellaceae bacterium]|nr:DNA-binding domain-containing protein [Coxiellaceae bacterium]
RWIATDLHLLADWFDAISGDSGQGGVLAHMLSLSKHEDIIALQNSLVQVPVKQKEAVATEHGQAFYDWLTKAIARGLIVPNAAESGIYITNQGVFLERHKLFRDFLEIYNQDVALQVVYAQFGNLMGIVKKGGHDFMNAQYFSGSTASTETGARSFGSPIGGQSSSLRDGMVLADPAMILTHNQIPAVSPMLRQMQSKGMSHNNLPVLDSSSAGSVPSPRPDPRKK